MSRQDGGMDEREDRTPVFRVTGLTRVYRTGTVEVQALRGVDLALAEGELVVLLGASGSGKSTLLNILGGLDRATEGRVFFREQELTRATDRALTAFRRDVSLSAAKGRTARQHGRSEQCDSPRTQA